jgi:uncharacterized protein
VLKSRLKRAAADVALSVFVALSASLSLAPLYSAPAFARMRQDTLTVKPASGGPGHAFTIEVASTDQEKALGLMFRTELPDSEGMLFPYARAKSLSMWMHNTYISLDMLFIQPDGTIARIEEKAEPLSDRIIASGSDVSAVLEIAGGASARLGIKPGDKVITPSLGSATTP